MKKLDILELERSYPNFIGLRIEFNPNRPTNETTYELTNRYLMSNKNLSEIKILEYSSNKEQKWEDITPLKAKELLEKHYFINKVKEWGLDKFEEKLVTKDDIKSWVKDNKKEVKEINSFDYIELKSNLDSSKIYSNFIKADFEKSGSDELNKKLKDSYCRNEYLEYSIKYLEKNHTNLSNRVKDLALKFGTEKKTFKPKEKPKAKDKDLER